MPKVFPMSSNGSGEGLSVGLEVKVREPLEYPWAPGVKVKVREGSIRFEKVREG